MSNEVRNKSRRALYLALPVLAVVFISIQHLTKNAFAVETRDLSEIARRIEKIIVMPTGSHSLATYDRYYANGSDKDAGYVIGVYRYNISGRGTVHLVKYQSLPAIFDGGCNVIRVRYSIVNQRIDLVLCNGEA